MADVEAEDRTQAPTKQKRLQARERGLVAHSPELTGAAGLLAAALALGAFGDGLASALADAVRDPVASAPVVAADAAEVVGRIRGLAAGLAVPLGAVLLAAAAAAVAAHQAQVGGLWAPALIAPDPSRLWKAGGGGPSAARGVWSTLKAAVVLAVGAWAIRSGWAEFAGLGTLGAADLARASADALRGVTLRLAAATLALGVVDFALRFRRLEAMLRMTPEEHREDQRAMEGDPALRSRRRSLAGAWRADPAELLAGAALVLTGPGGLTLVLAGGPPPRAVTVRSVARGAAGQRLRRATDAAGLPSLPASELAHALATRRGRGPTPAELLADLAAVWPAGPPHRPRR